MRSGRPSVGGTPENTASPRAPASEKESATLNMAEDEKQLSPEQEAAAQQAAVAAGVLRPEGPAGEGEGGGEAAATSPPRERSPEQAVDARPKQVRSYDVADFPVPGGREEEWRFTPLERLHGLHDGSAVADGKVLTDVDAPSEVRVETVERGDPRPGRSYTPPDRVSAAAFSAFPQATVVTVPQETALEQPVVVTRRGEGGTAYGHLVVEIGAFSKAVVVLDHGGSATYADNVEFVIGDSATLTVVSLQDWSSDAVHLTHHHASVGRDASFRGFVVTLGGDVVRMCPSVRFDAPGGSAELFGLYFVDAPQHLQHRLFVDHAEPHCHSNVLYKGALQGEDAHTVWIGDVLIRPEGIGTDSYEYNRNLVLTDGARADSVPNLEIETGEVAQCGHASATGRFDEEQLFYLMARGIPEVEARKLVVRGFFGDLIGRIEVPQLRERVTEAVEAELERVL